MTIREACGAVPMGMGSIALVIMQAKFPSLAEKLDTPISDFKVEFADGTCWWASVHAAQMFGEENGTPSDNRPGGTGDRGPVAGSLGLPG